MVTRDEYLCFKRFVKAVEDSGIDVNVFPLKDSNAVAKRRDLLGLIHGGLNGVGGEYLKLDDCKPSRICRAVKSEFLRAQRIIEVFECVQSKNVFGKVQELLSLEELARRDYERMPLFNHAQYCKAQDDLRSYVASLPRNERKAVASAFGERIASYVK